PAVVELMSDHRGAGCRFGMVISPKGVDIAGTAGRYDVIHILVQRANAHVRCEIGIQVVALQKDSGLLTQLVQKGGVDILPLCMNLVTVAVAMFIGAYHAKGKVLG